MRPFEGIRALDFTPVYAAPVATCQCRVRHGEDTDQVPTGVGSSGAELQELR